VAYYTALLLLYSTCSRQGNVLRVLKTKSTHYSDYTRGFFSKFLYTRNTERSTNTHGIIYICAYIIYTWIFLVLTRNITSYPQETHFLCSTLSDNRNKPGEHISSILFKKLLLYFVFTRSSLHPYKQIRPTHSHKEESLEKVQISKEHTVELTSTHAQLHFPHLRQSKFKRSRKTHVVILLL